MSEEAPQKRQLHPATLITRSLQVAPQMLAGGAGYAAVVAREGWGRVLMFAGFALGIGIVGALIAWWRFRYTVGDNEIVIESGLFHRQRRVIPFDRVQDIAIERRLLARLFGTAKVKIETGGSASDEGSLDMIALNDAHALRDHIRRRHAATPVEEGEAPETEPVLFEMTLGRLLGSGLFNFSLLFLAVIFAVFQYLDDFGIVEMEEWFSPDRADEAAAYAGYFDVRAALILVALLLILGVVSGVVRTVAKDFGYRLTRTEAGFRRRRGLFTLSEVVIPLRRTQVAVIQGGPVSRLLGWHALSFQTLGADQKEGGLQVAAPFARLEELLPILAEAGFPMAPPREEFRRIPRRSLVRSVGPYLLLGAAAAVGAWLFDPRAGFGTAAMLLFALLAFLSWRKRSYALGDRALFVSGGLFTRRLWVVPFERAQTISLYRSPLQRWLGLGTVLVDTAGASLLRAPEIVDLDRADAERLADRLLRLFYEKRAMLRLQRG